MSSLLYGWINFLLLTGVVFLLLRPIAQHFFFARRNQIKREIERSIDALKRAKARVRRCREHDEVLDRDIDDRRRAIEAGCAKECEAILAEARRKQQHVLAGATRQSEDERARAMKLVKRRILIDAFRRAEGELRGEMTPELAERLVAQGIEALVRERPFSVPAAAKGER